MNLLNIYSLSTAIFFHNLWISNERKCNSCWARNPSVYSLCPSFPSSSFSLGRRDGRDNKRRICYEEPNGLTVRPWAPFLLSLWCSWVTDRWPLIRVPSCLLWSAHQEHELGDHRPLLPDHSCPGGSITVRNTRQILHGRCVDDSVLRLWAAALIRILL